MHALQPFTHQFEAFAQARFQCALQLFIHSHAHLFQLARVVRLQLRQLGFHRLAHGFQFFLVAVRQQRQLRSQLFALHLRAVCALLPDAVQIVRDALLLFLQYARQLGAQLGGAFAGLVAVSHQFFAQARLKFFLFAGGQFQFAQHRAAGRATALAQRPQLQQQYCADCSQ